MCWGEDWRFVSIGGGRKDRNKVVTGGDKYLIGGPAISRRGGGIKKSIPAVEK